MKNAWKRILFVGLFLMLSVLLTVGVGAETYEADGGSATVYGIFVRGLQPDDCCAVRG